MNYRIIALIARQLLGTDRMIELDNSALLERQFGDDALN